MQTTQASQHVRPKCYQRFSAWISQFYRTYILTTFKDEKLEKGFKETFEKQSHKELFYVTISVILFCLVNSTIYIKLYTSKYSQLFFIRDLCLAHIIISVLWIVYSVISYLLTRKGIGNIVIYGIIHYLFMMAIFYWQKLNIQNSVQSYVDDNNLDNILLNDEVYLVML